MALNQAEVNAYLSEADYLQSERVSEVRREYIDGQIYAMTGASYNHNCIAANILGNFRQHLKGTPCATFMADIKVRMGKDYVYPDVVVDCTPMKGDDYFSSNPVIIVEVLSHSTRKMDLATKRGRYLNLPSLQEYVVIEQDIASVQIMRKANHWLSEYYFLGDSVTFTAIDLTLTVAEMYDRVDNKDMAEFRDAQAGGV